MTASAPHSQPATDYAYRFQYADESAFVVYPDGTAFIEFKDGRREQKYGVIDNRIPMLIGMSAKPRQDRIEELTKALENEREECAKLADMVVTDLSEHSKRAEAAGDTATMYRANTAWHRVKEVADLIRARSSSVSLEQSGSGK